MGNIANFIDKIKHAIYGKDVRDSIAKGIQQCYDDAIANGHTDMEVVQARKTYSNLNARLDAENDNLSHAVEEEINERENSERILQNQINALASGSPLVASSVSEMIDTSKVYVNTTDGHWYWYDGANWVDGDVYQATGIADNSVTSEKTNFIRKIDLVPDNKEYINLSYSTTTEKFASGGTLFGIIVKCKPNKTYLVTKPLSNRFNVFSSELLPANEVPYTQVITKQNSKTLAIDTSANDNYLYIIFNSNSVEDDVLNNIHVYDIENLSKEIPENNFIIENFKIQNLDLELFPFISRINIFNKNSFINLQVMKNSENNNFASSINIKTITQKCKPNTRYVIQKIHSSRFNIYTSTDFPEIGKVVNNIYNTYETIGDFDYIDFTTGSNDDYFTFLYYLSTQDTTITPEEIENSIMILENRNPSENYISYDSIIIDPSLIERSYNNIHITNCDDNLINLLSYRPVGKLTKPYIAISCDDGANALATNTIPLLKSYKQQYNKNIPVTFALMSNSQVFNNNNYKALVREMLADYGCSVAIHGGDSYTSYTPQELKEFLDIQKDLLTELCGVEPSSIIYPNHDYNKKTSTIAGSYFGVCCTGGTNKPIKYPHDTVGERSNMYTLYRSSLLNSFNTTQKIKQAIDYAVENNLIFMPFFHDNSLNGNNQELLDFCVSYGLQVGVEFINVGDIPKII